MDVNGTPKHFVGNILEVESSLPDNLLLEVIVMIGEFMMSIQHE